jgi:hypothetical protein
VKGGMFSVPCGATHHESCGTGPLHDEMSRRRRSP